MSVVLKPYDEDLIEMRWYQSDLVIANGEVAFGIIGSAIRKNHITAHDRAGPEGSPVVAAPAWEQVVYSL